MLGESCSQSPSIASPNIFYFYNGVGSILVGFIDCPMVFCGCWMVFLGFAKVFFGLSMVSFGFLYAHICFSLFYYGFPWFSIGFYRFCKESGQVSRLWASPSSIASSLTRNKEIWSPLASSGPLIPPYSPLLRVIRRSGRLWPPLGLSFLLISSLTCN